MPVGRPEVEKIAHLARLNVSEQEIASLTTDISKIIDLVDHINQAQTEGITPMSHSLETLTQRLREDEVTESNQRELFQSLTPHTEAGLYLVPKVIDQE
jgi:aspartyl-tRNA(Asn)/glutamyl-tRNA(Gln) amidotransferase subunit C